MNPIKYPFFLFLNLQKKFRRDRKNFSENAVIKAKHAGELINWKLPCLADDSGLSIKVLSNQPGVYSARWAIENKYSAAFKLINSKIMEKGRDNGRPTCLLIAPQH